MADTATYVGLDAAAQGAWKGVYGHQGYNVIGDVSSYPPALTVSASGNSSATWASSTDVAQALQRASSNNPESRIAARWYKSTAFTVSLGFSDAALHRVAFYFLDWDRRNRSGRVDVLDSLGAVLDTRNVSGYGDGVYLVWEVGGNVTFRFTNTTGAYDFGISGFFVDGEEVTAGGEVTQEHSYVGVQVDNTQSISTESADVATYPSNEQRCSAEHAIVSAWPANSQVLSQMFVVVATHEAPPPTMAELTVNKIVAPSDDDGKFNLLIDGVVRVVDVGNSGTTGTVEVTAGPHTVSESAGTDTDLDDYDSLIGGDAAPDGSITLAAGESKTAIIVNTRKPEPPDPPEPPEPPEPPPASGCPPAFTLRRVAVTLRRVAHLPVRGADN